MYSKPNKVIINSEKDICTYIENNDIYNSSFLDRLSDPELRRVQYEIKTNEYRPDLIAHDFYGSSSYDGILMFQVRLGLSDLTRGTVLNLIPKSIIDSIIFTL